MSQTNQDAIALLISARNTLVSQTDNISATAGQYLWESIDDINDEIDALTAEALATAPYVPQTDAFKAASDAGRTFISDLNDIKSIFANIDAVVKEVTSVLSLVLKL